MTVDDRGVEQLEALVAGVVGQAAQALGGEAPVQVVFACVDLSRL